MSILGLFTALSGHSMLTDYFNIPIRQCRLLLTILTKFNKISVPKREKDMGVNLSQHTITNDKLILIYFVKTDLKGTFIKVVMRIF